MESFKRNFENFKNSFNSFRNIVVTAIRIVHDPTEFDYELGDEISDEEFNKGLEIQFLDILNRQGLLVPLLEEHDNRESIIEIVTPQMNEYWNIIKNMLIYSRDNLLLPINNNESIKYALNWLDSADNPYNDNDRTRELKESLSELIKRPYGELRLFESYGNNVIGSAADTNATEYDRAFDAFEAFNSLPPPPPPNLFNENHIAAPAAGMIMRRNKQKKTKGKKDKKYKKAKSRKAKRRRRKNK